MHLSAGPFDHSYTATPILVAHETASSSEPEMLLVFLVEVDTVHH
jgi:hypothetical protein